MHSSQPPPPHAGASGQPAPAWTGPDHGPQPYGSASPPHQGQPPWPQQGVAPSVHPPHGPPPPGFPAHPAQGHTPAMPHHGGQPHGPTGHGHPGQVPAPWPAEGQPHPGQHPQPPQQWGVVPGHGQAMQPACGLLVTPSFFVLQWMLFLVKPVVTIGPFVRSIPWNQPSFIPLPPGQYRVQLHFPWLGQSGQALVGLDVHPGHATEITYRAPFFVFMSGTIGRRGFRPMHALPGGR